MVCKCNKYLFINKERLLFFIEKADKNYWGNVMLIADNSGNITLYCTKLNEENLYITSTSGFSEKMLSKSTFEEIKEIYCHRCNKVFIDKSALKKLYLLRVYCKKGICMDSVFNLCKNAFNTAQVKFE